MIDRPAVTSSTCGNHVLADGYHYTGSDSNIGLIREWLELNVVPGRIPPFQHPEKPAYWGAF